MLKWIIVFSALIAAAVLVVVYSPGYLLVPNASEKKSNSAGETVLDDDMRKTCKLFFRDSFLISDSTPPAQYTAACKCFADDFFEQVRKAPSGDMDQATMQQKTYSIAQTSIKKCVNQARTE